MSLLDKCRAHAGALRIGIDAERGKRHRGEGRAVAFDRQSRKQHMADKAAVLLRDQFQNDIAVSGETVDEIGFERLSEGALDEGMDGASVGGLRRPDGHAAHDSLSPADSFAPRRNSWASTARPPARWTSTRRTAPLPQAMVSRSSRTVPGAPSPSARFERSSFSRSVFAPAANSHHAPGKGDSPRMRLCTSSAGSDQSIRVSALLIFFA
jgi:hypothetical protein